MYTFRRGLIHRLCEMGESVSCAGARDEYVERFSDTGVDIKCLPVDKRGINPIADIRLLVAMYLWYREGSPAVVHHFTIKPVIFGTLAAKLAGVPRIVNTITGLGYAFTESRGWLRGAAIMLYRFSLRYADKVFFQNRDDLEYFVENRMVGREKCDLVPGSGVDLSRYRPSAAGAGEFSIDFLMISRLLYDKGIAEFVAASRELRHSHPYARCVILGGLDRRNPSAVSLTEVAGWEGEGQVEWHDQVDDVRPFIRDSKVVVLPSYREGTPRSLLEAAAMGKPLIATDVVGCREVVDDGINGILVQPRDPAGLAKAMKRLLEDPALRDRFGAAGRFKMEQAFDETIVIDRSIAAYRLTPVSEQQTV